MIVTMSRISMMTVPYIQYMRIKNKMAAPHIFQNFHRRNVSILPRVSAPLNPVCLSEGSDELDITQVVQLAVMYVCTQ